MPIYEYHCPNCHVDFEKLQSFSASKTFPCPECGHEANRIVSLGSFILKGTGWYVTDHPSKSRQSAASKEKSTPSSSSDASESAASSKSPESSSDSPATAPDQKTPTTSNANKAA